jgi:hypothetical protein
VLHLHNGDVVSSKVKKAGVPGDHVTFHESLITGAVVVDEEWLERRARAIADEHGHDLLRVRTQLLEQEQRLAEPPAGEVVLWFEHDLYCLIHLVYLMQRFRRSVLTLVWSRAPLGTLDDRDLRLAFESRAAVSPAMLALADEAWRAYIATDPTAINSLLGREKAEFPFLTEGLQLHASRFPSLRNGLGVIENRLLELIAAGLSEFVPLFERFVAESPAFGFGDTEILRILSTLSRRAVPLITIAGDTPNPIYALTPAGENVLRGEVDDAAINDPDQWLGGVHLTKESFWRWDPDARTIIPSRPAVF